MSISYKNKTILITGGTGSFGKAFLEFILTSSELSEVKVIKILSRDECKQDEMRLRFNSDKIEYYIADIRDLQSIQKIFYGVDYVFHAAALKQVPSCEFFPMEAVKTNIIGSQNVLEACDHASVKKIIGLSTDKAVFPINSMGMTKALMEKVFQSFKATSSLEVANVRYGNVLYSRGSVIPLFVSQIKKSAPLTITDPEMTRFLLPLSSAIELVQFAIEKSVNGEIYIKKAPAATVMQIAESVIDIFNSNSKIQIIGKRHGEKLYETLASGDELSNASDMGDYFCIQPDNRDLNYSKYVSEGKGALPEAYNDYHSHNTEQLDEQSLKDLLLSLPEIQAELSI